MRGIQAIVLAGMVCASASATAQVTPVWLPVANPGNANDFTGYGAVGYIFQISKYEVTNDQYVQFLNAKAASNTLSLYDTQMGLNPMGGITQSGSSGSFTYAVKPGRGNQPANFVGWYDSVRFANWMHNGQGSGDTETGAYTLLGGTPTPSNAINITRNPGAKVFLPSHNEWYKAAYYQPAAAGGDADSYWRQPTGTNTPVHSDQPPGDSSIQNNVGNIARDDGLANGYDDGYAVTGSSFFDDTFTQNYLTDVGAYAATSNYYGTFDQAGNVWEWNDTLFDGAFRGLRGGGFTSNYTNAASDLGFFYDDPTGGQSMYGIRLASIPEPASGIMLLTLAGLALRRRSRKRSRSSFAAQMDFADSPIARANS
jgi:formylglycine-generating enzyme required for sulfatase activity